ncbi:hypothetical protein [Pseudomonas sp. 22 E 5]|nr:hypothetical protein [Pseudomonas sp. 22 E 5]
MAVHQVAGEVMGQLVHRGGGIPIARLQQAKEVVAVGHQPIVMHAGVALIHRHRVLPVPGLNACEAFGHQRKGFVPRDRLPVAAHAQHGLVQTVRVVLDVLQRHGFWANVSAAERIQRVALDGSDRQAAVVRLGGFQGQTTDGFTQMAGTVVESLGHGQSLYWALAQLWPDNRTRTSNVRRVNQRA